MADMPWHQAVEIIRPHVVRISTPRGSGTGFLLCHAKNAGLCAVATAAHVIDQAHYWEEPIRVDHIASGESLLVRGVNRAIFIHDDDTAALVFPKEGLPLPDDALNLTAADEWLYPGVEIAWLGFPAIPGANLCFFAGRISAWLSEQYAYLVDGVAINGVSGGPAFFADEDKIEVMGVVSAYAPNRATGETLPGLSVVRDIMKLHDVVKQVESFDEAKAQETPPSSVTPSADPKGSPTLRSAT